MVRLVGKRAVRTLFPVLLLNVSGNHLSVFNLYGDYTRHIRPNTNTHTHTHSHTHTPSFECTYITVCIILRLEISSFIYYVHWIELHKLHVTHTHTRTAVCFSDPIHMCGVSVAAQKYDGAFPPGTIGQRDPPGSDCLAVCSDNRFGIRCVCLCARTCGRRTSRKSRTA